MNLKVRLNVEALPTLLQRAHRSDGVERSVALAEIRAILRAVSRGDLKLHATTEHQSVQTAKDALTQFLFGTEVPRRRTQRATAGSAERLA